MLTLSDVKAPIAFKYRIMLLKSELGGQSSMKLFFSEKCISQNCPPFLKEIKSKQFWFLHTDTPCRLQRGETY